MKLYVVTFIDQRDALLIRAPGYTGPVQLPELRAPFAQADVAVRLGGDARVMEHVAGRWTEALTKAKNAARSERAQRARLQEATDAALCRGSDSVSVQSRADAMQRKHAIDEELRAVKTRLGRAKAAAYERNEYLPPHEFRRLEGRLEELKQESQAVQVRLGELKRQEHEQNRHDRIGEAERFRNAARRVLTSELLEQIEDAMDSEESGQ